MKTRTIVGALLALALAAPVVATVGGFPDVPEDHPRAAAIRYAAERELFLGFPDGNLRPDDELTRTQFVKVSERLYDSADAWTRSDWAQVMYAGVPSLTRAAPVTTAPAVTGAPAVGDISLRCGWPLGEAEPLSLETRDQLTPSIRWPITPCEPPVTYRIEFHDQTLNLPYATEEATYTRAVTWGGHYLSEGKVKVTEFRPGGPVSGRVLGEVTVTKIDIRGRVPTAPAETIPVATTAASTATTAAPAPTTRATTATVPPRPRVEDIPFDERDVVVHWFVYRGSEEYLDTPLFAMYVADPDGPTPPLRSDGTTRSGTIWPLVRWDHGTESVSAGLRVYRRGERAAKHAFEVRAYPVTPENVDWMRATDSGRPHPFRSVTYAQVVPPSAECIPAWRPGSEASVHDRLECHPAEWARWWDVWADW